MLAALPALHRVVHTRSLPGAAGTNDPTQHISWTAEVIAHAGLGTPAVVCGPGSMAQGHKPDEFVSVEQLRRCDEMLERLLSRLADGWP